MSNYIFTILFILLVNVIIVESSTHCLDDTSPEIKSCYERVVDNGNKYFCINDDEDIRRCLQLATSECNLYDPGQRRLSTDPVSCSELPTSDSTRYKCVPKRNHCIEEGKSECLRASIYSMRRRLSADLDEEYCNSLATTSTKKKCVLADDETQCNEKDFSFGLNINKLSLFVFCLLFFL